MSKVHLWWAKKITKRIEKYEGYVEKVSEWIKKEKKELKKLMKELTAEENLQYGRDMGFVDDSDYQIMKQELEDNKNSFNFPAKNKGRK